MIANFSSETLTLPKSTVLGVAEGVSESLADCIYRHRSTHEAAQEEKKRGSV